MKNIIVILPILLLLSCGVNKKVTKTTQFEDPSIAVQEKYVQKAIIGEAPKNNPTTEIKSAYIEEDTLYLKVSYSGGCKEHVFDLVGDAVVMRSFPPKRSIVLVRNSHGDKCRELITREIMFELSEFQYVSSEENEAEIILQLENWTDPLHYKFE